MSKALWVVQVLLAVVFLVVGASKLVMPAEALTAQFPFPAEFIRFIGICEVLGSFGLVLPGLFRIRTGLTSLAAAGLVIIMIGATATTLAVGAGAGALVPLVLGLLAAVVAYGRTQRAPLSESRRASRLQTA
jgi:putative oxidoreductase